METYSTLLLKAQNLCVDDTTKTVSGLSTTPTFLALENNNTIRELYRLCREYNLQPLPKTATTVAQQIWYHYPPGLTKIETVTIAVGSLVPTLRIINSQEEWDRLHQVPISTGYPVAIFPRRDDFGVFPTPQSSGNTITFVGNYTPTALTVADYVAGTVTVASNSKTVTGASTTFTSSMVGRWFSLTDSSSGVPLGNWYRVGAYTSATVLSLENYFQDATTGAGLSYLIGQSPDIPEELQEFIPYRSAGVYYFARRRDTELSQRYLNFFYTGDFENNEREGNIRGGVLKTLLDLRQKGRGNSQMVQMGGGMMRPQLMGGIWSTVISA